MNNAGKKFDSKNNVKMNYRRNKNTKIVLEVQQHENFYFYFFALLLIIKVHKIF